MSFRPRGAAELVDAYRAGRTTPREVAERALAAAAALDRLDPPMRHFVALDGADVRAQADESAARWRTGRERSPLDGVPIAVKDELDVRGYPTTAGTSFLARVAAEDAVLVAHLRAAGAVIFGKTNMHEVGMGPSGLNPCHGTARNPHDPARDTGGSSSGSAGAVAAGVVPIAIGSDSGGSIRMPGALCGVAGLKGTFDRVPTGGAPILYWSLQHFGPLGATVDDVGRAFAAIGGAAPARPTVGKPRIGLCEAWWREATPEVAEAARAALDRLDAELISVELPHLRLAAPVYNATMMVEAAAALEPHLAAGAPFSPSVRLMLETARAVPAPAYVNSQRVRALIAADFARALERCDLIATPTTAITAPLYARDALLDGELDDERVHSLVVFTSPANLTGLPAAQVPCGVDSGGLPVGLQLIAAHDADELTLTIAAAVERTAERRRPRVWFDLLG